MSGLTTNERLVESGMIDAFDHCVRVDDRAGALAILQTLRLSPRDAEGSYEIARRDPAIMGRRGGA